MLEQGSWGKSWAVRLTLDGIIYKPFHWQSWTDWEKQQSSLRDDGKKIEWIPNIRFSSFILNQFELQIPIWFANSKFSFSMFNIYTDINLMLKVADVEATSAAWICCLLLKPAQYCQTRSVNILTRVCRELTRLSRSKHTLVNILTIGQLEHP